VFSEGDQVPGFGAEVAASGFWVLHTDLNR